MTIRAAGDRSPGQDVTGGMGQEAAAVPGAPAAGRVGRRRHLVVTALLALVVAAAGSVSGYVLTRHTAPAEAALRPSGIPASISTSLADLMNLDSLPGQSAPGFTFTDQDGRTVALSDLRGKVVVLEFLDPHCTDICPIVSREFIDAYHDLGPLAGKVVFAGINVNSYHTRVQDVLTFSTEQQLTTIPDWHYLTGPVRQLQPAWRDYHIYVQAPNPNADIVHTSAVYVIDRHGAERFLASPEVDHTSAGVSYLPADQVAAWGRGIAALARSLTG